MADVSINFPQPTGEMVLGDTGFSKYSYKYLPDPKEWVAQKRQLLKPWLLFLQTSNFKGPSSLPRLSKRILKNIEYFQANYLCVFLGLVLYCLLTSPLLLILIAGSLYIGHKLQIRHAEKKVVLFGRELTLAEQYGLLGLCMMPVFYLLGAHAIIFWVIGASVVVITIHAAFYNIDAVTEGRDSSTLEV